MIRSTPRRGKNFEEQITILVSEIEMAVKWQRASILVAVYRSVAVLAEAQAQLEQRLASLGLRVCRLKVDKRNYNIPDAVAQVPDKDRLVVCVTDLGHGGGPDGANAYRQLNLQREYFVENGIRLVVWVSEQEAIALSQRAPDFWAFRHRVVEFTRERVGQGAGPSGERLPLYDWTALLWRDNQTRVASCERLLADLPVDRQALSMRADLLYELASLRWANGETNLALELLLQGLQVVEEFEEAEFPFRFLNGLGIARTTLGRLDEAMASYQRAVELRPNSPIPWMNLIETYRLKGQRSKGIAAFKKAVRLAAGDPRPWNNVGNLYADWGRYEQAAEAYQKAISLPPADIVPWLNLGHLYLEEERPSEASRILAELTDRPEVVKGLRVRYKPYLDRVLDGDGLRER